MIRMASTSVWLCLIAVATALAQRTSTITEAEVCTAEDYLISTVALNDFFAQQKPDRVLLRDHTARFKATVALFLPTDVLDEAKVNFNSRNKSQAKPRLRERISRPHLRSHC